MLFILALGCAACAPPTTNAPPKSRTETVVAKPDSLTEPTRLGEGSLPTAPTLAIVDSSSSVVVHIDGERLRKSPLVVAYRETVAKLGDDPLAAARASCGFDPVEAIRFITWTGTATGGGKRDFTGAAAISTNRPPGEVVTCVQKLLPGLAVESVGELVLAGDDASVRSARSRIEAGGGPSVPDFARAALSFSTAALAGAMRLPAAEAGVPIVGGALVVAPAPERLLVHTEIELDSVEAAREMQQRIDPKSLAAKGLQLLVGTQRTWLQDRRVVHELTIDGDQAAQVRQIGALASIGVHGARQYLGRAKESEAKHNVMIIAKGLLSHLEGGKAVPASAPRTPRDVPKGAAVTSDATWWRHPTWTAASFSVTGRQYFAYEVEAAPGRQKVVVRAVGDLDGDGVLSKYSVTLSRGKDGRWAVAPELEVENELD